MTSASSTRTLRSRHTRWVDQKLSGEVIDRFDPNDVYHFYVIHGFKITYGDTRSFKQTSSIDINKDLLLKFSSGDDSSFDVNETDDQKKLILSASVFLLGQVRK